MRVLLAFVFAVFLLLFLVIFAGGIVMLLIVLGYAELEKGEDYDSGDIEETEQK